MDKVSLSEAGPAAAIGGSLDDFEALVERHRPRVFRFILASLRDKEVAENLTQDCFLRAYKARNQFRGESAIGTWLMQIAANLIRSHEASGRLKFWRRNLRPDDISDFGDWIADPQLSPEQSVAAKEQVEKIWKAAGTLPGKQRSVFLLRYVEDLELLEIASVMDMKEGTVKVHLFRALQSIRAALKEKK